MAAQKIDKEILKLQNEVEYWSRLIQQHKQPPKASSHPHVNQIKRRSHQHHAHNHFSQTHHNLQYSTNYKLPAQHIKPYSNNKSWVKQDTKSVRHKPATSEVVTFFPSNADKTAIKSNLTTDSSRAVRKRHVVLPCTSKHVSKSRDQVISGSNAEKLRENPSRDSVKDRKISPIGTSLLAKSAQVSNSVRKVTSSNSPEFGTALSQTCSSLKRTVLPPKRAVIDSPLENQQINLIKTNERDVMYNTISSKNTNSRTSAFSKTNTPKYKWTKSSTTNSFLNQEAVPSKSGPRSKDVARGTRMVHNRLVLPPKSENHMSSVVLKSAKNQNQANDMESVTVKSRYKLSKSPVKSSRTVKLPQNVRVQHSSDVKSSKKLVLPGKSRYKLVKPVNPAALKWHKNSLPQHAVRGKQASHLTWRGSTSGTSPRTQIAQTVSQSIKMKSRYKLVKKAIQISNKRKVVVGNSTGSRHIKQVRLKVPGSKQQRKEWTKKYSLKRDNSGSHFSPIKSFSINQALGRKVINLSQNKFKFIKPQAKKRLITRNNQRKYGRQNVAIRKALSLDRRPFNSRRLSRNEGSNTITIHGIIYQTSRSRLKLVKSSSDIHKRNAFFLRRHSGNVKHSTVHRILDRAVKVEQKREIASHLLQRSIVTAQQARYKKVNKHPNGGKYCLIYNRFGRCHRGANCKKVHDPKRVAVCTRFLRGRCEVTNCPFSHIVSKQKMPVCQYFLRGMCNRDNCPYLHSNVNKDAEVCEDFVQGFCALGDQCKKKHSLVCSDFARNGTCSFGAKCPLKHIKRGTKKKKVPTATLR